MADSPGQAADDYHPHTVASGMLREPLFLAVRSQHAMARPRARIHHTLPCTWSLHSPHLHMRPHPWSRGVGRVVRLGAGVREPQHPPP